MQDRVYPNPHRIKGVTMKRIPGVLSLTLLLGSLWFAPALAQLPEVGKPAPDFTLMDLDGELQYTLSALQDSSVVYLDFWASWCGPCRRAFPEVMKLYEEYSEQGLEVLAISLDRSEGPAKQFIKKQGSEFPALIDVGAKVARIYGASSIPTTVIVAPDGTVAYAAVGFDPRKMTEIRNVIEGLLAEIPSDETE
ncbi:MAG: TlpA disulfide reductase family protein [Candidatus Krumholzibacteria bacterium]|jgi:peroxiredoxin|nr:TlpA disulfide reductase family protein [Candidatus Krumholzibacteria bacterium]